jgi:hypothetical protein
MGGLNTLTNVSTGAGVYGTLGTSAPGNQPGCRSGGVSWTDKKGNFWLWGGEGLDANFTYGYLNDLWVYQQAPPDFTVSGTAVNIAAGATTGNTAIITVTPTGGFTGSVTLTAAITTNPSGASLPPTLSFSSTSPSLLPATQPVLARSLLPRQQAIQKSAPRPIRFPAETHGTPEVEQLWPAYSSL